jgi:hypothetical protein
MMRETKVLPRHVWPSGLPKFAANLRSDAQHLSARLAIPFEDDVDGLGDVREAYVQLPSGRVVALRQHLQSDSGETVVYVDASDAVVAVIDELKVALSLSPDDFSWIADEAGA